MAVDRGLFRLLLTLFAAVLAAVWLFAAVVTGFAVPAWIPPSGLLALALAALL